MILLSLNSLYDSPWLDTVHEEHRSIACGSNLMMFIFVVCFCFRKQFMFFMRFVLRNMSQDCKFMRIWDAKCEWAPASTTETGTSRRASKQECDWIKTNLIPRKEVQPLEKEVIRDMESKSKIGNYGMYILDLRCCLVFTEFQARLCLWYIVRQGDVCHPCILLRVESIMVECSPVLWRRFLCFIYQWREKYIHL